MFKFNCFFTYSFWIMEDSLLYIPCPTNERIFFVHCLAAWPQLQPRDGVLRPTRGTHPSGASREEPLAAREQTTTAAKPSTPYHAASRPIRHLSLTSSTTTTTTSISSTSCMFLRDPLPTLHPHSLSPTHHRLQQSISSINCFNRFASRRPCDQPRRQPSRTL